MISELVVTALTRAGLEVPEPSRVRDIGYSAAEVKVIDAEHNRRARECEDLGLDYWTLP